MATWWLLKVTLIDGCGEDTWASVLLLQENWENWFRHGFGRGVIEITVKMHCPSFRHGET